jgi:hypothetical protein
MNKITIMDYEAILKLEYCFAQVDGQMNPIETDTPFFRQTNQKKKLFNFGERDFMIA